MIDGGSVSEASLEIELRCIGYDESLFEK